MNSLLYTSPLADEMRPNSMKHYKGQKHLLEKIRALSHMSRLPSLLLIGPPGCGKSSLALLLARKQSMPFLRISAPEAGISDLRKKLKDGQCLILDELHRFSKAQQDFFLPLLESGSITLIATTTENPSFCVTRQLLSRLHILKLNPLEKEDLEELATRALTRLFPELDEETEEIDEKNNEEIDDKKALFPENLKNFLVSICHGDARVLLNLIELVSSLPQEQRTVQEVQKVLPEIIARHDKKGDNHYERISALIKSIRGSDPDAALYYLGTLLEAGEDPRFISRRLILSASEDVGLADPTALSLAVACQQAVEFVGMPEGFIPLAETTVYLALAPKSNSSYAAYKRVAEEIKRQGIQSIPLHLRNASTSLQKEWSYGKEYKYPHDFKNAYVEQEYLPDTLAVKRAEKGKLFYSPKDNGKEKDLYNKHIEITNNKNTKQ